MNVSNNTDRIAEGLLWSTVIVSHRSIGMLSHSQFMLGQERWPVAQAITSQSWPLPITSQGHVKQPGIWEGQSSQNDWNLLMGQDSRGYLHSNWNPFPLRCVFLVKEQNMVNSRLPGWIKTRPVMLKITRKLFFYKQKKSLRKKSMFQRLQGTNRRVKPARSLLELNHARKYWGHHFYCVLQLQKRERKAATYTLIFKRTFRKR